MPLHIGKFITVMVAKIILQFFASFHKAKNTVFILCSLRNFLIHRRQKCEPMQSGWFFIYIFCTNANFYLNRAYLYEKRNYIKAKSSKFKIWLLTTLLRNVHSVLPGEAALLCKEVGILLRILCTRSALEWSTYWAVWWFEIF